jgi:NAD(P)-dependent dehydrogenase (short-subunit alcohol dehydrogenase family)
MLGFVGLVRGVSSLSQVISGLLMSAVVPSAMNPMGSGAGADIFGDLVEKVPAKRAGGVDDMAGVVLFLVSKAGAYVDGKSVVVDGGRTLFANGQV